MSGGIGPSGRRHDPLPPRFAGFPGFAGFQARPIAADTGNVDVLNVLRNSPCPLSDDELAEMLGRDRRSVSHECRGLAFRGLLIREQLGAGPVINKVSIGDC